MCNYFMEIFGYNTQMSYIYIEFKTKKKNEIKSNNYSMEVRF